jgi:uncharacterized cupin superfamily protein
MEKVIIEKLPEGKEQEGAKRWHEERGEFIQIVSGEVMRHLALFEIKKGFQRGSHYHLKKEEVFYIHSGKIKAVFHDMDSMVTEEQVLTKGMRIRVRAGCGHIFHGIEDALIVEYSPQDYDRNDTFVADFDKQGS